MADTHYDLVLVGTGFASSFYLDGLFRNNHAPKRILAIEAGSREPHSARLQKRKLLQDDSGSHIVNRNPEKPWVFSVAFGGGSNCWYGSTPRMLPQDFKTATNYGVGSDWPLSYDDLEPFYGEAEAVMQVSGGSDVPYPMSRPYPLPPHRFSEPDQLLKKAYPDRFFVLPTARSSVSGSRAACCNNGVCFLCPVDAKFTIENGLKVYDHAGVDVLYDTRVTHLEHSGTTVSAVVCNGPSGRNQRFTTDRVVLGANAIFNPHILLRSGIESPQTGLGLTEQVGVTVMLDIGDTRNFQGSTITTGLGLNDLFGSHRSSRSAFMFNTVNRGQNISLEPGRPFSRLEVIFSIEDFRRPDNRVLYVKGEERPVIEYRGHSQLAQNTLDILKKEIERLFSVLPLRKIESIVRRPTEAHLQCSTPMGTNRSNSVVDQHCIHHDKRNLIVLGSGVFPSASPTNPTLTIAALSLYSARHTS